MDNRTIALTEVACKSLLQPSKMAFTDFHINPYGGCQFGCSFCYVPALRKFRGQEWETWGQWVQAKTNAPAVLRREIAKIRPDARITIGSATDAWQPIEKRLGITRAILEELAHGSNPIGIITRSPLLLRDIPILQRIHAKSGVHVGISLSSFDDRARRVFEPRAPAVKGREHLARALVEAGIPISLFWMPLLPGVSDNREAVEAYMRSTAALGVHRVVCDLLNYRETMGAGYAERLRAYYALEAQATGRENRGRTSLSRAQLAREIRAQAAAHGVECQAGFA